MNDFTALSRPEQSQVKIEPTAKPYLADGFNYPNFRLLNKLARVTISQPWQTECSAQYHLLAIANSRGWFAAVRLNGTAYELVFSTLEDLRSSNKGAKEGSDNELSPKRVLPLNQGKPNIITFSSQDSRLFVGLEQGTILVYDTASIFSSAGGTVAPVHATQLQSTPLRQIVPNPGTESNLYDHVAVVGNGTVQIFNSQLESHGGWSASDADTNPVAVAWSPKGKHIAIGLQTGDILTFALTNMSTPHKHIPPTSDAVLVSLNWTGPGHTFRTSYSPPAHSTSEPSHHIIVLDTKTSTAVYYALAHPFPLSDRTFQSSHVLQFPKWDEDAASTDHQKSLFIVGDSSSVDLEIVAHEGNNWYQQSQENPVTLPLNKSMDDTMLLSLDADLTDVSNSTPIVYAYLNDGTIQGWYLEHTKPYAAMVAPQGSNAIQATGSIQTDTSMSAEQDEPTKPTASSFGQQSSNQNAFGQPSAPFGPPTSAFGSSSFGQSSFGQQNASAFGQTSSLGGFSSFAPNAPSPFGQATSPSSFSEPAKIEPTSSFGSFGGGSSAFGGGSGAFSSSSNNVFGGFGISNSNSFGQGSFGSNLAPPSSGFGSGGQNNSTVDMIREASMSDETPSFGGLSLGSSNAESSNSKPTGGIFGSFRSAPSNVPNSSSPSAFGGGGLVKPATGFGAFGNLSPDSNFNDTNSGAPASATSAFASDAQSSAAASPAFGKSSFGQSSFGQSSFGQSSFGQPAFSQSAFGSAPATGGFGAFANKPASFADSAPSKGGSNTSAFGAGSTSGFASFASPSGFTSAMKASDKTPSSDSEPKSSVSSSSSPFSSNATPFANTSGFGGGNSASNSPFGLAQSPFGKPASFGGINTETPAKYSVAMASPPSSPESSPVSKSFGGEPPGLAADESPPPASAFKSSQPPVTGGAFGNLQTSPSAFRPASGFGAFGSSSPSTSSPFYKKTDDKAAPVSAFAALGSAGQSPSASAPTSGPVGTPTFGSTSLLGVKSAFPPPTPPSPSPTPSKSTLSGGFGAFSNSPTGFTAFAGSKTSFSDLLKTGGDPSKDPVKPPTIATQVSGDRKLGQESEAKTFKAPEAKSESEGSAEEKPKAPISVFSSPKKEDEPIDKAKEAERREGDGEKSSTPETRSVESVNADKSFGEISSAGSSFVEVGQTSPIGDYDRTRGREGQDPPHDDDDDDTRSFLSNDFDSDGSYRGEESEDEQSVDHETDDEDDGPLSPESPFPEPTAVPLPKSRSSSATPQPEVPNIKITPSPPATDNNQQSKASETAKFREASTTPPGTPAKEASPLSSKSPSPSPTPSAGASSPFSLGLGRPSTRPTRSSPLASTPLSGDNDDEEREAIPRPEKPKKAPLSPKPVFGVLPLKDDASIDEPPSKRPRTPPLLSAFGPVKPSPTLRTPTISPAILPMRPATTPPSVNTDKTSSTPSLFSTPSDSLFTSYASFLDKPGTSPFSLTPVKPELTRPASEPIPLSSAQYTATASPAPLGGGSFNALSFNLKGATPAATPQPSLFGGSMLASPSAAHVSASTLDKNDKPAVGTLGGQAFSLPPTPVIGMFGPSTFAISAPPSPISPKSLGFPPAHLKASLPATAKISAPPEVTMEEGMQKECAMITTALAKELDDLRLRAQEVSKKREELGKTAGGSWQKPDLGNIAKWSLGDAKQFGQVLVKYADDLNLLKEKRETERQALRELNSSMLKAGTRREEISRFNKAQNDAEFAKMLRGRTLGPEHSETQIHLRRNIRSMKDRVQKLESNLQASKKKLAESISGRPSIRAPSLDTINRTFRNIDIAVTQQADDVTNLTSRVAKLNIRNNSETQGTPPTRDSRLPDPVSHRPYNVTPNVAITTAAALNAERSAQKLKKALALVRKEPLLNVKAAAAPPPPVAFSTPQKSATTSDTTSFAFRTPLSGPLFSPPSASMSLPDWTLPEDDFNPSTALPARRGAGSGNKKHSSVQLKRSHGVSPPAAAPAFDWGPLPAFNNPPLNALAASIPKFEGFGKKA